jgi:hypothetical protein
MALSNLSKDKMLMVENLICSFNSLYKQDLTLVNLLGNFLEILLLE